MDDWWFLKAWTKFKVRYLDLRHRSYKQFVAIDTLDDRAQGDIKQVQIWIHLLGTEPARKMGLHSVFLYFTRKKNPPKKEKAMLSWAF